MDLTHHYHAQDLFSKKHNIKKIFFYRVCGTGMGACACLLKQAGYHVEGADSKFFPPMSEYLKSTQIPCHSLEQLSDEKLKNFDLIVVGNVVPRRSQDAERIESLGVPFCSFPAALGGLVLYDQNVVGISGTHGKTTTTYFAMQIFKKLGFDPGYLIGGVLEDRPSSFVGDGSYFFIESDEYDSAYFEKISKFRMYYINHLILTSLEFDHADIYNDLEEIKNQFRAVLAKEKKTLIFNTEYQAVEELLREYQAEGFENSHVHKYGRDSECGPIILESDHQGTVFKLFFENEWHVFKTNVIGEHNIYNLSSIIFFALSEGIDVGRIQKSVEQLEMVKRRQEIRGLLGKSLVIDDFAHHPRAVELTIQAVQKRFPDKKVNVIFEPNSATARSSIFQNEFSNALSHADDLIITTIERQTTAKSGENLNLDKVVQEHIGRGKRGKIVSSLQELISSLDEYRDEESILLVLSNGTCMGLWESDFVEKLV